MPESNMYKANVNNLLILLLLLKATTFEVADPLAVHPDHVTDEPAARVRGCVASGDAFSPGGQVIDDELPDDLRVRAEGHPWAVSPFAESLFLPEPPFLPFCPGLEQEGVEGLRLGLALGLVGQSSLILGFETEPFLSRRRCSLLTDSFLSLSDVIGETSNSVDSAFRHLS